MIEKIWNSYPKICAEMFDEMRRSGVTLQELWNFLTGA